MPQVKVGDAKSLVGSAKVGSGRADYTTDVISNVNVTVQEERLAAVMKSSIIAITTSEYNSDWFATGDYIKVRGGVFSNASGTLYIEQSDDGSTLIVQTTKAYTGASYSGGFIEDVVMPYVRVRFVPTGAATTFRIRARLSS